MHQRSAWQDLGWLPAPPPVAAPEVLDGRHRPDLLVVGMGASGLAATVAAAQRGADVVALDAVGIAAGAAGANGGFLLAGLARFHHAAIAALGRRRAVAWYRRTLAELDLLAQQEPTFRRVGSVRTIAEPAEAEDVEAHLQALREDGLPVSAHEGPEGRGLLLPSDGVFHPVARCRRLAVAALEARAALVAPVRVTSVAPGAVQVEGRERPLAADRVLVAVDGGLERLVPSLAGRVRTARLQMLATAPTREVELRRPVYSRWGLDYLQQLPTGEVVGGGGRDRDEPWGAPAEPTDPVQRHLERWLADAGIGAAVTHRWAAHAAFTEDRMPVDERIADGVHVVGAYSGHGNVLGPLLAREAALDLLEGSAAR